MDVDIGLIGDKNAVNETGEREREHGQRIIYTLLGLIRALMSAEP